MNQPYSRLYPSLNRHPMCSNQSLSANRWMALLILTALCINACTQTKVATGKSKEQSVPLNMETDYRMKGVDLVATGNQPVDWRLEMDFDKEFRFMTKQADSMVTTAVKPVFDSYENKDVFRVNVNKGTMEINIYRDRCKNQGKQMFRVTVKTPDALYTGCYTYLGNSMLQGNWNLELIDEKPVSDFSPASTPTISINLASGNMKGFDGCNTISAPLTVQGDRLLFGPLLSTKKFCEGNKTGDIFIRWISDRLVNYSLSDEILTLYLGNDSRMVFRRG